MTSPLRHRRRIQRDSRTQTGHRRRRRSWVALLLSVALFGSACTNSGSSTRSTDTSQPDNSSGGPPRSAPATGGGNDADSKDSLAPVGTRIEVLSSQPDRATGPEARVRITPGRDNDVRTLIVKLGDQDVTGQLSATNGYLEGVVTGLVEGNNTLVAEAGGAAVTQRIRSWPLSGPMISGPQSPLLVCSTEQHGLGPPSDDDCSAPAKVVWKYVTTTDEVKDLPDPAARPVDLATATIDGKAVPLLVRYERGVANRSVYEIASVDPSAGGPDHSQADAAWNGRLIYRYGSGCATTYGQGSSATDVLAPAYLKQGYAIATATFNTGAVQCNDVVSAETTMMVKERFIEEYGEPTATIGEGASGGTVQLHLIAQNYPGLLDGAVALDPLPDLITVANGAADCGLLNRYYRSSPGRVLTAAQRTAVNGHATTATCDQWERDYGGLVDPSVGCDPAIPRASIYVASTNPGGVRCTFQDGNANALGRDTVTGHALRALDNTGLQYGLEALNDRVIGFDQFLKLNEHIGGYDLDGRHQAKRHAADPAAVQSAYETGRVASGVGDQRKIPIIDVSLYDDPTGAVADHFRAFSLRDRLTQGAPAESAPGFRIWVRDPAVTSADGAGLEAVAVLDGWLSALAADHDGGDRTAALQRSRPATAVDNCLPAGAFQPVRGTDLYNVEGPCRDNFPIAGDPRTAAGGPRADDVLKCQLKPVDLADYRLPLTEAQYNDLLRVFASGVCDWASAGVGQTTPSMSDRTFADVITPGELA